MTEDAATCGHGPLELGCVLKEHAMLWRFPELKEEFFRCNLSISYFQLKSCSQETNDGERMCTLKTACPASIKVTGWAGNHAVGNLMDRSGHC